MCSPTREKRKNLSKPSGKSDSDSRKATSRCKGTTPRIHLQCPTCKRNISGIRVSLGGDYLGLTVATGITDPLLKGMVPGVGLVTLTLDATQERAHEKLAETKLTYNKGCKETFLVPFKCLVRPRVKITARAGGAGVPGVSVTFAGKDLGTTNGSGIAEWPIDEPGLVPGDYKVKLTFSPTDAKKYRWVDDSHKSEHTVSVQDVLDPTFPYEIRRFGKPKIQVVRDDSGEAVPDVKVALAGGIDYGTTGKTGLLELLPDADWLEPKDYNVTLTLTPRDAERYVPVDATPKLTVAEGSEATTTFRLRPTATLIVEVCRYDGAKLPARVRFNLAGGGSTRPLETEEFAGNDSELDRDIVEDRKKLTGLAAGDYTVTLTDVPGLLAAQKGTTTQVWRLGPSKDGIGKVRLAIHEIMHVRFTLTRMAKVQFIGFHATPNTITGGGTLPSAKEYHGRTDDDDDLGRRCIILKNAITEAYNNAKVLKNDDTVLKVLMAPEFYFRGKHGGYPVEKISHIMEEMRDETKNDKYKDWLFVYGTAIGYLKHGSGSGATYELSLSGASSAAKKTFTIGNQTGKKDRVDVCKRIPANWPLSGIPHYRWTLKQGSTEAYVTQCTPGANGHCDVTVHADTLFADGPIQLVEPEATEVFNIALVQKGGEGKHVAGLRDAVIYKERISAIDFLGVMFGRREFYDGSGDNRKIEIHGQERTVLPTEGSRDTLGGKPNVPAPNGPSELTRHGLGGGSIFNIDGITFGLEICRDHILGRLRDYFLGDRTQTPVVTPAASPGDPRIQVQLVPSWGAEITPDSITGVEGVLVFNVDGRPTPGCKAGKLSGKVEYKCAVHTQTSPEPKVCTTGKHYRCFAISESTTGCGHCGAPRTMFFESQEKYCTQPIHVLGTLLTCNVGTCTAATHVRYKCTICNGTSNTQISCPNPACANAVMVEERYCDQASHKHPSAMLICACSNSVAPKKFYYCTKHDYVQGTTGTCAFPPCGSTYLHLAQPYKMQGKDVGAILKLDTQTLKDAKGTYKVVTETEVGDASSPTKKKTSYDVKSHTVKPQQTHYFAAQGEIVVFAVADVPEAETV
jgi:hypothetical protein